MVGEEAPTGAGTGRTGLGSGPATRTGAGIRDRGAGTESALATTLAPVLTEAVQAGGGYGGGIYLRSRDRRSLVLALVAGVPRSLIKSWWRMPVSGALPTSEAYRTEKPVHLSDEGETMRRYPQMAAGLPYAFASAYLPVRAHGEVVGVLVVLKSLAERDAGAAGDAAAGTDTGPESDQDGVFAECHDRLLGAVASISDALGHLDAHDRRVEYDDEPVSIRPPDAISTGIRVGLIDWDLGTGAFAADADACAVLGTTPETFGGTVADVEDLIIPDDLHELRSSAAEADEKGWVRARKFRVRDVRDVQDVTENEARYRPVELWGRIVEGPAPGSSSFAPPLPPPDPGPPPPATPHPRTPASPTWEPSSREALTREPPEPDTAPPTPGVPMPGVAAPTPGVAPPEPGGLPAPTVRLVGVVFDAASGSTAAEAAERLPDGVFSLDQDGHVAYVNHHCEELLRCDREDLLGRHPWHVLTWLSDPAYEDRYRAAMLSQEPTSFLVHHPAGEWLGFVLYPDVHGLTGRIFPSDPPPRAAEGEREAVPEPRFHVPPETTMALTRPGALYHVVQMASVLTEAVTVREVCVAVAEQLLPAFGGQELAMYVVRDRRMYLAWESGYPEGFLDRFEGVSLDAHLPGVEALTTGVPIFFESPGHLSAAYPGIALDRMHAWAFLPLIASSHPVGSLILGYDAPHGFTADERAALTALGGLVAQALERARLYDAEFTLARGLQDALLPHRLPPVEGLRTAGRYLPGTQGMEIGGDWYDVIETSRGVALVIGDVEGHSVAAAAVMGQLRSAVNAFASSDSPPQDVVCRTNRMLAHLDAGVFATCCYIELDPRTGLASAVRAGHPQPVLRHPDGSTEVLDLPGGTLLGVDPEAAYPVTRFRLPVDGVLALYTDGLVEQPGHDIDLGVDRMRAVLAGTGPEALEDMADHVVQQARIAPERPDDVALLLTAYVGTATADGTDPAATEERARRGLTAGP
ncbi:SpoIIE family protein phosphatase [Streptomyces sp. NPDC047108]|uniref:SpoIIE family protein phosphatase n=1 Tax=Streptomyces sp. NPDC047108 TaxID=3155025 RepID=UPI0033DE6036